MPNSGSIGGTTIELSVPGITIDTQSVLVKSSSGSSICEVVRVTAYGKIQCETKQVEIVSTVLKITVGEIDHECEGADPSVCTYEQLTAGAFPAVDTASVSGSTIVFGGSNLFTTGHTASASFNGIASDSVVIDSASQATATWTRGVPLVTAAMKP
mgnify:CR=1 FL=1